MKEWHKMWKIFLTFVKVEAVLERVIFDLPCNILDQIYQDITMSKTWRRKGRPVRATIPRIRLRRCWRWSKCRLSLRFSSSHDCTLFIEKICPRASVTEECSDQATRPRSLSSTIAFRIRLPFWFDSSFILYAHPLMTRFISTILHRHIWENPKSAFMTHVFQ